MTYYVIPTMLYVYCLTCGGQQQPPLYAPQSTGAWPCRCHERVMYSDRTTPYLTPEELEFSK